MNTKIPDTVKKTPRCPLCHALFERRHNEMVQQRLDVMLAEAIVNLKASTNDKELAKAKRWCELLDVSIKGGAAEVFLCNFCKIGIACNDPMVGHWEEVYAKGEKIFCPACDHEMRFFCTSTGFMLAQCPVKTCRSRMQLSAPDRKVNEASAGQVQKLYDPQGNELALPNIDRAIATPDAPALGQVGGNTKDASLPDETTIYLPKAGNA